MECPICLSNNLHIFQNVCQHTWCKTCHKKLIDYSMTKCPLCRCNIYLKKPLKTAKERFLWEIHGGKILPRWLKKHQRSTIKLQKYILAY